MRNGCGYSTITQRTPNRDAGQPRDLRRLRDLPAEMAAFLQQPFRMGLLEEAGADLTEQICEATASTAAPVRFASDKP